MDAYREDLTKELRAAAHRDAHEGENDKKVALRHGRSRRTANRWSHSGHPDPIQYAENTPDPSRIIATLRAEAVSRRLEKTPTSFLISTYHAVLLRDKTNEGHDTVHDLDPRVPWRERAASTERDAADDILKAAIEREFAVRRVTVQEVMEA